MIRPDLLKDVWMALGSHRYLSQEDFKVQESKDRVGSPAVEIEYRYGTNLAFRFSIPTQRTKDDSYRFGCVVRPGYESVEETLGADSRTELESELRSWLGRLYDDVVSLPIGRQLHEHTRAIDQLKERLAVLPDEPMSRTDVEVVSEGLEKLKTEFLKQLEKESANTKQLENRVGELTRDIEFLKHTLDSMTKRQWSELLWSRVQQWRNRLPLPQIAAGAKALKLFMPSETLDVLESVVGEVNDVADAGDGPAECKVVDD